MRSRTKQYITKGKKNLVQRRGNVYTALESGITNDQFNRWLGEEGIGAGNITRAQVAMELEVENMLLNRLSGETRVVEGEFVPRKRKA